MKNTQNNTAVPNRPQTHEPLNKHTGWNHTVWGSGSSTTPVPPRFSAPVRVIIAIFAFVVSTVPLILLTLLPPVRQGLESPDVTKQIYTSLPLYTVTLAAYILIAILLVRWVDRGRIRDLGIGLKARGIVALLAGTGLSVLIAVLIAVILPLFPAGSSHLETAQATENYAQLPLGISLLFLIFRSFVLQGIGEELLMRGYVLQTVRKFGPWSVWIAAVAFTLPHLLSSGGQQNTLERIVYLIIPFGLAISAGYLAILMRSVWAAVGIHGGFHVGTVVAVELGMTNFGPLAWVFFGVAHLAAGLLTACFISKDRWQEVRECGPYSRSLS